MADEDKLDRVGDIIERQGMCMLITRFEGGLRGRPLQPRPDRDEALIWFVTDLRSGKEQLRGRGSAKGRNGSTSIVA